MKGWLFYVKANGDDKPPRTSSWRLIRLCGSRGWLSWLIVVWHDAAQHSQRISTTMIKDNLGCITVPAKLLLGCKPTCDLTCLESKAVGAILETPSRQLWNFMGFACLAPQFVACGTGEFTLPKCSKIAGVDSPPWILMLCSVSQTQSSFVYFAIYGYFM